MLKVKYVFFAILTSLVLTACVNIVQSVLPKGELVVLSHGLGRSDTAMWRLEDKLEQAGFEVCSIDYDTIGESVEHVLAEANSEIENCIKPSNRIHFVGHSLGGLVIKHYLATHSDFTNQYNLGEVVMVGTPNKGSEVADKLANHMVMNFDGGIGKALMTGEQTLGNQIPEPSVAVGVIAGTSNSGSILQYFSGPNDGLVSVESAKFNNMKDFISLNVSHSAMRYNEEVASQIIHFINKGIFKKSDQS